MDRIKPALTDGSSPLTRGKRTRCHSQRTRRRLIPAHAGKTSRTSPTKQASRAHPRSRGENDVRCPHRRNRRGSSPLTRGKLTVAPCIEADLRLIPAHAGKTRRQNPSAQGLEAHPRSRGENRPADRLSLQAHGSSPLTRGKLRGDSLSSAMIGLIPAHAGKTGSHRRTGQMCRAHPRSRGENKGVTA